MILYESISGSGRICSMCTTVFLQVAYQNDPEGALIQFSSPEEAKRAMQSTEAVLNNRFIKVHWFRADGNERQGQSHFQQQPQSPMVDTHFQTLSFVSTRVKINLFCCNKPHTVSLRSSLSCTIIFIPHTFQNTFVNVPSHLNIPNLAGVLCLAALSDIIEAVGQRSPWTPCPSKLWTYPRFQCCLSGECGWRGWAFTCHNLPEVCVNIMHIVLLMQNSNKVSVKDRLGFSTKVASPVEKVSHC